MQLSNAAFVVALMAFSAPVERPTPATAAPPFTYDGIWKISVQPDPTPDADAGTAHGLPAASGTDPIHGTFTRRRFFRLRAAGDTLDILDENADFVRFLWTPRDNAWISMADTLVAFTAAYRRPPTLLLTAWPLGGEWDCDGLTGAGAVCPLPTDGALWTRQSIVPDSSDATLTWRSAAGNLSLRLERVPALQELDAHNFAAWSNVFNLPTEIWGTDFPFLAYDIRKMDPRDIPGGSGTNRSDLDPDSQMQLNGRALFVFPTASSRRYMPWNNHYIPWGVLGYGFSATSGTKRTTMASSVAEHRREWSLHLGLNIEVPEFLTASISGGYKDELTQRRTSEKRSAMSRFVDVTDALVADVGHLVVTQAFDSAARRLGANPSNQDVDDFLLQWGTHYANAVTLGGMSRLEERYSERAEYIARTQEIDLQQTASVGLDGVLKVGENSDVKNKWTTTFEKTTSTDDISMSSVGGTQSSDGQFSVTETSARPIMLDLRPLPEILNPIFFPDRPEIWFGVRPAVEAALARMSVPDSSVVIDQRSFFPHFFRFETTVTLNRGPDHDGGADVYGSLALTPPADSGKAIGTVLDSRPWSVAKASNAPVKAGQVAVSPNALWLVLALSPAESCQLYLSTQTGMGDVGWGKMSVTGTLRDHEVVAADEVLNIGSVFALEDFATSQGKSVATNKGPWKVTTLVVAGELYAVGEPVPPIAQSCGISAATLKED